MESQLRLRGALIEFLTRETQRISILNAPCLLTSVASLNKYEVKMAAELRWDDAEDLGIALADKYPEQNPLEVRFTDLHRYVTELPTFVDDAKASSESKLEAIQMAWYEEYQDRNE